MKAAHSRSGVANMSRASLTTVRLPVPSVCSIAGAAGPSV
jgi:hypothetical protein